MMSAGAAPGAENRQRQRRKLITMITLLKFVKFLTIAFVGSVLRRIVYSLAWRSTNVLDIAVNDVHWGNSLRHQGLPR